MQAKMANLAGWVKTTEKDYLKTIFDEILGRANFNVLTFVDHAFTPYGYTALWLLSESHFAVHTFPESGRAYFELSSCNLDKQEAFEVELQKELGSLIERIR